MGGYINTLLLKYVHPHPSKPQISPHKHRDIQYSTKQQLTSQYDMIPPLDAAVIKRFQSIVGALLYPGQAVIKKLPVVLSTIRAQQASSTQNTNDTVSHLLDYVATYPDDDTAYQASDMILSAHSDVGFNNESKGQSRAGSHIFLSEDEPTPKWNGAVLTIAQTIK